MLVTRNITTNGKIAEHGQPDPVEDAGLAGEGRQVLPQQVEQAEQRRSAAPASSRWCGGRAAAGAAPAPAVAAVSRGLRWIVAAGGAVAVVVARHAATSSRARTSVEERLFEVVGAAVGAQLGRGGVGDQLARRGAAAAGRSGRPRP